MRPVMSARKLSKIKGFDACHGFGAAALPCEANGDVTCDGNVAASVIIHLVNYVFKSGADPCNTCTSPLASAC